MPFDVGISELLILFVVLLLVFGAKRLPEMGRSLGKGMREFRDGIGGLDQADAPVVAPRDPQEQLPADSTRK